jgi:hypothetical protein
MVASYAASCHSGSDTFESKSVAKSFISSRPAPRVLAAAFFSAVLGLSPLRAECSRIDDPFQVLDLHLEIDPAEWEALRHEADFQDDENLNPEHPAVFRCGDEAPFLVNVRRKRLLALPSEDDPRKVSLKVDFDDRVEDQEWHSHRKLSLENGAGGVLFSEGLAWQLLLRAGATSGACSWVRLHVNGDFAGVYLRVEEVDKSFLRRRIDEDEGFLYEVETRETREGEQDPFAAALCYPPFADDCAAPPSLASLPEHCDVHQLLATAAVNAYLANWDSLFGLQNNYFWYSSSRPRLYFPWDLDAAISRDPRSDPRRDPHRLLPEPSRFELLFGTPWIRNYFDEILLRLIDDALSVEAVERLIDEIARAVGPAIDSDPLNGLPDGLEAELARLRAWLRTRNGAVRRHLAPSSPSPIVINEVLASNVSTAADEAGEFADWVELYNRGAAPARLGGLYLSDDPARPRRWALPDLELEPGEHLLVWCDRDGDQGPLHAGFQLDAGGEQVGLYAFEGALQHTLDFVRFPPQSPDRPLGRFPDGAPGLRPLPCATPSAANRADCPPGAARMLRGDSSGEGRLNLSDAVLVLGALFARTTLPCLDAADANDDGRLSVADALVVLHYLFAAGNGPASPFPRCGGDPTPDALGCDAHRGCD